MSAHALAALLRAARLRRGWSQAETARRVGWYPSYVCELEHGRGGLSPQQAIAYGARLGLSDGEVAAAWVTDRLGRALAVRAARVLLAA